MASPDQADFDDERAELVSIKWILKEFRAALAYKSRAEVAEKDARRYRWLRQYGGSIYNEVFNDDIDYTVESGAQRLDAAIDATMKPQNKV